MNDIEREFAKIKARIRYEEKKLRNEQRAQEMKEEGFEPITGTCTKVFKELKCGNCGEPFYYVEENSLWYLKRDNVPNFCKTCGARVKWKGLCNDG